MKKCLLLVLAAIIAFASCKKDKADPAPESVTGYWTGTWKFEDDPENYNMAVNFRDNGTARVVYNYTGSDTTAAEFKTEGFYTYEDGELTFSYYESTSLLIHEAQPKGNSMSGTWKLSDDSDNGTFKLSKK